MTKGKRRVSAAAKEAVSFAFFFWVPLSLRIIKRTFFINTALTNSATIENNAIGMYGSQGKREQMAYNKYC